MLQRFNKLAFCLASAIIATNVQASEYIVSNYDDNNKTQICDILSKYRFPSILSPFIQKEFNNKYPNLNLMETFKTKESEYQFIQNAVQEIDPKAKVYAITKSLYQFIVYNYFAETTKTRKDIPEEQFQLNKYANKNEEWALTKACGNFMKNKEIQSIFWTINEYARNIHERNEGNIEKITNELLDKFIIDKQTNKPKRHLDFTKLYRDDYLRYQISANMSRIETLLGVRYKFPDVELLTDWNETMRNELKQYILNCIVSEANNLYYVIYRGGKTALNPEITYRQSACFSDGLFSGWMLDAGASAFELSGGINKLWKLGLDRKKLLEKEYPIFIPPAFHLLSAAGKGELFHIRTKVVQGVYGEGLNKISEGSLAIQWNIKPLVAGYKLQETPEYFTTQDPEILQAKWNSLTFKDEYEKTSQGKFDKDGSEKLKEMVKNIKEVPANGIF